MTDGLPHKADRFMRLAQDWSVQVGPVPRHGRVAIGFPAKLGLRSVDTLELVKPSVSWQPLGQRGGLLVRARLPQAGQQPSHGAPGRRGRRGRRRGRPARWPARARPPPAGCPAAQATADGSSRETWAAARSASAVACSCAPASRRLPSSPATADGSSRETWAAARSASAVICSCAPASRRLSSSPATAAGSSRETWAAARSASTVICSCAPASRRPSSSPGHGGRVVEGDVGGGAFGQRGGLLVRARLPQAA